MAGQHDAPLRTDEGLEPSGFTYILVSDASGQHLVRLTVEAQGVPVDEGAWGKATEVPNVLAEKEQAFATRP